MGWSGLCSRHLSSTTSDPLLFPPLPQGPVLHQDKPALIWCRLMAFPLGLELDISHLTQTSPWSGCPTCAPWTWGCSSSSIRGMAQVHKWVFLLLPQVDGPKDYLLWLPGKYGSTMISMLGNGGSAICRMHFHGQYCPSASYNWLTTVKSMARLFFFLSLTHKC